MQMLGIGLLRIQLQTALMIVTSCLSTSGFGRSSPTVGCLIYQAASEWHHGEIASSQVHMDEAIALAKEQNDKNALALALQLSCLSRGRRA